MFHAKSGHHSLISELKKTPQAISKATRLFPVCTVPTLQETSGLKSAIFLFLLMKSFSAHYFQYK